MGAWIEIRDIDNSDFVDGVAPLVGAWIEILTNGFTKHPIPSLLSWERGLKSCKLHQATFGSPSLLSWERGLKFYRVSLFVGCDFVAPLVGAWIEIVPLISFITRFLSLLSWERGLKFLNDGFHESHVRRSSRGSVD